MIRTQTRTCPVYGAAESTLEYILRAAHEVSENDSPTRSVGAPNPSATAARKPTSAARGLPSLQQGPLVFTPPHRMPSATHKHNPTTSSAAPKITSTLRSRAMPQAQAAEQAPSAQQGGVQNMHRHWPMPNRVSRPGTRGYTV